MDCNYCEYTPTSRFKFLEHHRLYKHLVNEHVGGEVLDKQQAGNICLVQRNRERNGYPALIED